MYTVQAEDEGRVLDMLDPPVDPLMRRGRTNTRDIYNPVPIMPSANGGSSLGAGFDLDQISNFDTEVSKSDDFSSSTSADDNDSSTSSSSSWWNPMGK
jgi:hypothetical protein